MLISAGGTKSFSADEKVSDARLFRYAEPKPSQVVDPGGNSTESRICASPNVRGSSAPRPSESAAGIAEVLIEPAAFVPVAISVFVLQHGSLFDASQFDVEPLVSQVEIEIEERSSQSDGDVGPESELRNQIEDASLSYAHEAQQLSPQALGDTLLRL